MYKYFNPNPSNRSTGDCVIRGISKVTNQSWNQTYLDICAQGYELKDMPSTNHVWESYLYSKGFERRLLPDTCPNCYTVQDFCVDYPNGIYLLATGSHVIAIENGNYYDAWDSGNEIPVYYWERTKGELDV